MKPKQGPHPNLEIASRNASHRSGALPVKEGKEYIAKHLSTVSMPSAKRKFAIIPMKKAVGLSTNLFESVSPMIFAVKKGKVEA